LAAAAVLAVLAALGAYTRSANAVPWLDECNYLNEANWIAEHGGATGFVSACVRGAYPFDSRTPGLPLLGSFVTQRTLFGVRPFRALNAALAFAALLCLYALLERAAGWKAALFAAALLSASQLWADTSAILGVEPFVYLPYAAAWLLLSGWWRPRGRWLWAGVCVGLAYFFKGTANLLVLAAGAALVVEAVACLRAGRKPGAPAKAAARAAGWGIAGFCAGAWPVLLNNTVRYGNPLHNKNAGIFWMDAYDQRLGGGDFSLFGYLQSHSLAECLQRLGAGLGVQWENLLRTFGSAALPFSLLSAAGLGFALYGLARDPLRWRRTYSLALAGLFVALFAWWARFGNVERFTGTLGPLLAVYAACAAGVFLRRTRFKPRRLSLSLAALGLCVAGSAAVQAARIEPAGWVSPRAPLEPGEKFEHLRRWIETHALERGEVTLVPGYFRPRYDLFWLLPQPPRGLRLIPPVRSLEELRAWDDALRAQGQPGAVFLIVELNSWRDREALFEPYRRTDAHGRPTFELPGWKLVDADPYPPYPDYLIYQRD
ncbi:MAG: glycosyltransferase family 39 protein, partial [Planctomycetota bacterium]|nr:glycosyltransferase family 39 protein [Planctomycetota bacterium]